jgi:hypothetical protein
MVTGSLKLMKKMESGRFENTQGQRTTTGKAEYDTEGKGKRKKQDKSSTLFWPPVRDNRKVTLTKRPSQGKLLLQTVNFSSERSTIAYDLSEQTPQDNIESMESRYQLQKVL